MQVDEAAVSHGNSGHCNSETSANVDRSIQQNSVHCKFDTAKQDEAILVLYIFSGKSRKGSVSHWCSKLSKRHSRAVKVEMVDIKVTPHIDLTQKSNRDKILQKMKDKNYNVIIFSPPCSTFSRAPWSNRKGPRPVRSFVQPRGLTRLSWTERKKAEWGNTLKEFTFEAIALALQLDVDMILFENPEDLGAMQSGPYEGQRPASMWQDVGFEHMVQTGLVQTVGFYQQDFGTDYLKPTRLLLKGFDMHDSFAQGQPEFDDQGRYLGPLQKRLAARQLIGQQHAKFNTTGSEQWPSDFCRWVAEQIFKHVPTSQSFGGGSSQGDVGKADQQQYKVLSPEGPKVKGGLGEPRVCRVPGKVRDFHDGAGLASPGRWDVENRLWNKEAWITKLRGDLVDIVVNRCGGFNMLDKICFDMSVKGEAGCEIVKDENLKNALLDRMVEALSCEGVDVKGLLNIAEGQPFRLRLMQSLLQQLGDADHLFLLEGEVGFPVGVLNPLPRTPHMYEEQTSWKLEDDPYMREEIWRENYDSVGEHESFVREHFDAECEEGLMEKLSMEEAKKRYGDKIAISSLSVLVEEMHGNKKRIIHDATHGTKINNRIKCRDKQRSPGAREKLYLLDYYKRNKRVVFSLVGDISKAHRRFLHHPSERGLLACKVNPKDDCIYINRVGTFGVASASYWWGRIAGAGLRLVHEILGPEMPVELLIFADDLEAIGADRMGRRGIVMTYIILSAFGFPFKWAKQRGGLKVEWIGLFADYTSMKLGLSPKRAKWMADWTLGVAKTGRISSKEMEQGLGRLGFAANALTWERPFLGPLYSWSAAIRNKKGVLKIPVMLRTLLFFLHERLAAGDSLQDPPTQHFSDSYDIEFFTDAKATEDEAWVGGFLQNKQGEVLEWFSEKIDRSWAEWLFVKKDLKRIIASLELLATLIAIRLWAGRDGARSKGVCWIRAGTDNQSNTYAVSKMMSTKYPLTLLVMELSETLRARGCELNLQWIPREKNQLADDLTNEKFDHFPAGCRVRWIGGDAKWLVLDRMIFKSREFFEELQSEKIEAKNRRSSGVKNKKRKLGVW